MKRRMIVFFIGVQNTKAVKNNFKHFCARNVLRGGRAKWYLSGKYLPFSSVQEQWKVYYHSNCRIASSERYVLHKM